MTWTSSLSTHGNILSHPFLETCLHPVSSLFIIQSSTAGNHFLSKPVLQPNLASKDSIRHCSPFCPLPSLLQIKAHAFLTLSFSFASHNSSKCNWISPFNPSSWSPSWFSCTPGSKLIDSWKDCPWRSNRFPKTHLSYRASSHGILPSRSLENQSLLPSKESFIQMLVCFTPLLIWNSTNSCHCNQHSHWVPQPQTGPGHC